MFHITQPLDSIRYMIYNGYYKVMSNIPKMGHLTTPEYRNNLVIILVGGWYTYSSEKKYDFVSWDDDIPN